jgi:hypothetical protein
VARLGGTLNLTALLFSAGEKGGIWDPSYLPGLFQNSNGTTAAGVGDPVGYVFDRSGNGNHAIQATAGKRPILRQDASGYYYLEYDGTDDCLQVTSCVLAQYQHIWAAVDCDDSSKQFFVEQSANAGSNNGFWLYGADNLAWMMQNSNIHSANGVSNWLGTAAAIAELIYNASEQQHYKNAVAQTLGDIVGGRAADANITDTLNIGSRNNGAGVQFQGKFYGLVIRSGVTAAGDVTKTRTWIGAKAGLSL